VFTQNYSTGLENLTDSTSSPQTGTTLC